MHSYNVCLFMTEVLETYFDSQLFTTDYYIRG